MKKIFSTLVARHGLGTAALLLSGIVLAGGPADVHGWGKVKWGMTLDEIQKLYPEAKPYQPKNEAERDAMKASDESALELPGIDLVNTKFEVNFVGQGAGKEILFVEIYSRAGVTEGTFTELEKQLRLKHGEPAGTTRTGGSSARGAFRRRRSSSGFTGPSRRSRRPWASAIRQPTGARGASRSGLAAHMIPSCAGARTRTKPPRPTSFATGASRCTSGRSSRSARTVFKDFCRSCVIRSGNLAFCSKACAEGWFFADAGEDEEKEEKE